MSNERTPLHKMEGVDPLLDVCYEPGGHRKHYLDVYRPSTPGPHPTVLFVHGGGWKRGDRRWKKLLLGDGLYGDVGVALAQQDVLCAVMSYRLASMPPLTVVQLSAMWGSIAAFVGSVYSFSTTPWQNNEWGVALMIPMLLFFAVAGGTAFLYHYLAEGDADVSYREQVVDVRAARQFLADNARTYGIDANNVYVMGHSSGAHVSFLDLAAGEGPPVQGFIGISGVYNLGRLNKRFWFWRRWYLDAAFGRDLTRERLEQASPLTYASNGFPFPCLLLTAQYDAHLVRDAEEFQEQLALGGTSVQLLPPFGGYTHHSIIAHFGDRPCEAVVRFVREQSGQPTSQDEE